jgi:hypothetical protein
MNDVLITSKLRTISLLFVATVLAVDSFAAWQLSSFTSPFTAQTADTSSPPDLISGALLNVETLRADTELLTITQTMAANEAVAGAIATNRAQFITRMDQLAAALPGEVSQIETLKHREDALLRQACRGSLLRAAAATALAENASAQTVFLTECLPPMQSVAQGIASEQMRVQAQAAVTALALQSAAARATDAVLAMMLGSLSLAGLCAAFWLRGAFKPLTPLQEPTDPHAEGAAGRAA